MANKILESIKKDKDRYLTGILLVGILALILVFDIYIIVWLVLGAAFIIGLKESLSLYQLDFAWHYYITAGAAWLCLLVNDNAMAVGIFAAMGYAGYMAYRKSIEPKVIFPFLYPMIPFLAIFGLYDELGRMAIVWLIACVSLTDTFAYIGGRTFGRTPFSPISPKKTIEGVVCGIVCGVLIGSGVGMLVIDSFVASFIVSVVVSFASVFGDLFESYLKREANVKDSGDILPGHGGVLDRMDGILFGAMAMSFGVGFVL